MKKPSSLRSLGRTGRRTSIRAPPNFEDGRLAPLRDSVEPAATAMEHEEMDHGTATAGAEAMGVMATGARADELPIVRSRSGIEWGIVGLVIGLSAGLGLGLVRSAGGGSRTIPNAPADSASDSL